MQLVTYPNPILLEQCKEVPNSGAGQSPKERASLASAMWKIMDENHGAGLAAPQVGLNIRMFVWSQYGHNMAIWNPKLTWLSGEMDSIERCLSLPGIHVTIKRAIKCTLSGTNIEGLPSQKNKPTYHPGIGEGFIMFGDSITTKIWQHEIDHLNGQLIIDNMSHEESVANRDALKKLLKEHRGLTR